MCVHPRLPLPAHCNLALNQIHDSGEAVFPGFSVIFVRFQLLLGQDRVPQEVLNESVVGKNLWGVGKPLNCRIDMSFFPVVSVVV